ncbi:MAG: serine hydrolase [Microthrixaceae bacterium]
MGGPARISAARPARPEGANRSTPRVGLRAARPFAVALSLALVAVACEPPPPPPAVSGTPCKQPFTAGAVDILNHLGFGHRLTAAVFDDRTGCWYHYRRGERVSTASVVQTEILAGVLLRAQLQGRPLTATEQRRIVPMMAVSDDRSANALWSGLGGEGGMEMIGWALGLAQTDEVGPKWGLTTTTAEDQARFTERLVQGPGILDHAHRGLAWLYLRLVRSDQRWGVTAGVPDRWQVGLKNGSAPSRCCGWRINSVGYVADPIGGGYSIAVLSDGWPSPQVGIPVVEAVARIVNGTISNPAP